MDQLSTVSVLPAVPSKGSRSAFSRSTLSGSEATSGMRNTSSLHLPANGASALPSVSSLGRRSMTTRGFSSACAIAAGVAKIRARNWNAAARKRVAWFIEPPVAIWTARGARGSILAAFPAQRRELALQERRERASGGFDRGAGLAQHRELRHLQARVAAGVDALEGLEVHVHV